MDAFINAINNPMPICKELPASPQLLGTQSKAAIHVRTVNIKSADAIFI